MSEHVQQSFAGPEEKAREVLERLARMHTPDHITLAVSGGTDSVFAADVFCRFGPEYGLTPDSVTYANTGAYVPQTRLVAKTIADIHGLEFHEAGYRNRRDSLAHRILEHGWPGGYGGSPATGGHGLEWANRKAKPMDGVYVDIDGFQVWGSGARKLESKNRSANLPDSGINQDKPRRVWCAIVGGCTSAEKREYIRDRGLPVSEAYLFLGYSGECTACAFDGQGLLTGVDMLSPELGHAIRTLTVWLYQRARRGEADIDPKQLCWGWSPDDERDSGSDTVEYDVFEYPTETATADHDATINVPVEKRQAMVGCDTESCADRDQPTWILDLPAPQIVTRSDVETYWQTGDLPKRFPIA